MSAQEGVSTGGVPRVPVAYGQYEVGRSKNPSRKSPFTSPFFKDGMTQQQDPERNLFGAISAFQGDPGAYEPYEFEDAGTNPEHNSESKNRKPFDSTEVRELRSTLFAKDTPSVGMYPVFEVEKTLGELDDGVRYPKIDANVSVFKSSSLQRPNAKSDVPGSQHYHPNFNSIHANIRDSGASMRSEAVDCRFQVQYKDTCGEGIGPGTYGGGQISGGVSYIDLAGHPISETSQLSGTVSDLTLEADSQIAISRASRLKPGFGTTSIQRLEPGTIAIGHKPDTRMTPAPGCYAPLEPKLSDLLKMGTDASGQAAWRAVM